MSTTGAQSRRAAPKGGVLAVVCHDEAVEVRLFTVPVPASSLRVRTHVPGAGFTRVAGRII